MRRAQALLARAGFDPHKVQYMTEAEVESHLAAVLQINGAKSQGNTSTSRFKGHRKKKDK